MIFVVDRILASLIFALWCHACRYVRLRDKWGFVYGIRVIDFKIGILFRIIWMGNHLRPKSRGISPAQSVKNMWQKERKGRGGKMRSQRESKQRGRPCDKLLALKMQKRPRSWGMQVVFTHWECLLAKRLSINKDFILESQGTEFCHQS